jgi:hypothetical protein
MSNGSSIVLVNWDEALAPRITATNRNPFIKLTMLIAARYAVRDVGALL